MMQKVYAPARNEGIMKQQDFIEKLNEKYVSPLFGHQKQASIPYKSTGTEDATGTF